MSDFNSELYNDRKAYWLERFERMEDEVIHSVAEDQDAFYNAMEDFLEN